MGDVSIAADIIEGVADAMADVGSTRTLRLITYGDVDPDDPTAPPTEVLDDNDLEALLFEYNEKYMPNTSIEEGETMCIVSIQDLTDDQVDEIIPGNYLIDGSTTYSISAVNPIEVAGITVTAILQLKAQ
jgi:hypothetical protein